MEAFMIVPHLCTADELGTNSAYIKSEKTRFFREMGVRAQAEFQGLPNFSLKKLNSV